MAMLTVIVAGIFETCFALLLKKSHGLTKLWPSIGFAVCALISFGLLTIALKKLEVGTAYAIWTGIGAGGTAILGMVWFGDQVSALKIVAIALILAGVICLNFTGVSDL
jgi:quaternary ammonium compound-resistance protein SugE